MSKPSLKQLSEKVADIEQRFQAQEQLATKKDWPSVVGLIYDCAVMNSIIAEGKVMRASLRENSRA